MPTTTDIADAEATAARLVATRDPQWLDAFATALHRRRIASELAHVLTVWDLSRTEAGRLFGVTRQAISKWIDGAGVPADRAAQIADLAAATDLLEHYLKASRIPAVVRRPAAALGGRSLLDLVAAGATDELLAATREMFTFTDAHG